MSVSFINELNEIVIFRPATAHPEAITFIKVTKVNYFWLGHTTKYPGQAFRPSHQADQGAPQRSSTQKALRFAQLISPFPRTEDRRCVPAVIAG